MRGKFGDKFPAVLKEFLERSEGNSEKLREIYTQNFPHIQSIRGLFPIYMRISQLSHHFKKPPLTYFLVTVFVFEYLFTLQQHHLMSL